MKTIALTGASETTQAAVAERLLTTISTRGLQLAIAPHVKDAATAGVIYTHGGELWRIGEDENSPELDFIVDRWISDETPERMQREVDQALYRFLNKTAIQRFAA